MINYKEFLTSKINKVDDYGFEVQREKLNSNLFEFQKDILVWSLKKRRAALFEASITI